MDPDLAGLRRDYTLGGLADDDATTDPLELFRTWFAEARRAAVGEPNAMVLATLGEGGVPASRTVLLKGVDERGFSFYTGLDSRKAVELRSQPECALLFGWYDAQRQVRVEGSAAELPREEVRAYFATRPRASQLGAWASIEAGGQSSEVPDRATLEAALQVVTGRFAEAEVPCPDAWGGFVVTPSAYEFWQGRHGRMHDRLAFRCSPKGWRRSRLAP